MSHRSLTCWGKIEKGNYNTLIISFKIFTFAKNNKFYENIANKQVVSFFLYASGS